MKVQWTVHVTYHAMVEEIWERMKMNELTRQKEMTNAESLLAGEGCEVIV